MNDERPTASPAETRSDLLRLSGSGYLKVRHTLCQLPRGADPRISVLGPMVTARKRRALQLYLLLLTVWPWLQKQDRPLDARVWARALSTDKGRKWSTTNVSNAWRDLEDRGLITRRRVARGVWVEPRREDGAAEYTSPAPVKGEQQDWYFVVPPEFWTEEWFERLSMPGLAVLLILLSATNDKPEQWFTHEALASWYGLSPRSVASALSELEDKDLIEVREEWVPASLSGIGHTQRFYYSPREAFSTKNREDLRRKANAERHKRVAAGKMAEVPQ